MTLKYASIASSALPESKEFKSSTWATPFTKFVITLAKAYDIKNGAYAKPWTTKERQETKKQETNKKKKQAKNTVVRKKDVWVTNKNINSNDVFKKWKTQNYIICHFLLDVVRYWGCLFLSPDPSTVVVKTIHYAMQEG